MKKIFIIAVLTLMAVPYSLFAGSIDGVTTQGEGQYGVSLDLDWSFDRDLNVDKNDLGVVVNDVEAKDHYTIPVKLSYGLTKNVDIYGQIGYSKFKTEGNIPAWGKFEAESEGAASYAIGAKGSLQAVNGIIYGVDAQYSYSKHDNEIKIGALRDDGEVESKEWHVAPFIAKQYEGFLPYAGFRYSDARYENDFDTMGKLEFEAKDNWGVFAGVDYAYSEVMTINLEVRALDETAVTIGATNKF